MSLRYEYPLDDLESVIHIREGNHYEYDENITWQDASRQAEEDGSVR